MQGDLSLWLGVSNGYISVKSPDSSVTPCNMLVIVLNNNVLLNISLLFPQSFMSHKFQHGYVHRNES